MHKTLKCCPLLALLLGALPGPAAADTIILKNGNQIQGEIIEETPQRLTVRFVGGVLRLSMRDVAGVRRESRLDYLLGEGEATLRRDDPEGALEIYRQAQKQDPSSEAARKGLQAAQERYAEELRSLGRHREALSAYDSILALAPDHPRAREAQEKIQRTLREAAAEEEAGLEALRRGAVAEAATRLLAIYQHFPDRRATVGPPLAMALIRTGDQELSAGKAREAEGRYLEAVSIDPDQAPAMTEQFVYARATLLVPLVERGDFRGLLQGAEEGLRIAPGSELLAYFAALGLEGVGRVREAKEGYRKVAGLTGARDLQKSIDVLRRAAEAKFVALASGRSAVDPQREEVLAGDWREETSDHFIVRHKNKLIGQEVARAAEEAYDRLHQELACRSHWTKRCTVTIYPSQSEFLEECGQLGWTGGGHRITRRAGMLADHSISSFQLQPRLCAAVIPHEVAHAMLAFRLAYPQEIPLWLNEGFAVHWEPSYVHRYYAGVAAQAARARTLLPLTRLLGEKTYPANEAEVKLFYAESHSLVELLLEEKDLATFLTFARELSAAPESLETLLEARYRIRGLKALWNRWVARLVH